MVIEDKNLKLLVGMATSLKKARLLGKDLDCECGSYNGVKCGKHKLIEEIEEIEEIENKIKELISNY